jgi:hypothetical protein
MSTADDRDLERYLRRDDALSRAYAELKSERPSPALDQAVLARARDALHQAPRARATRKLHWPAITALAATVLLSFGLVMRLALEPEVAQQAAPSPTADAVSPLPQAPTPMADDRVAPAAESKAATPFGGTSREAIPRPSSIEEQRSRIESEISAAAEQAPAVAEPVPPSSAAPDVVYAPPPAPAQAPADARRESAPAAKSLLRERADSSTGERDQARAQKSEVAPATTAVTENAPQRAVAGTAHFEEPAKAKEDFTRTPEAWLAEIARLRAAGETEAADREFERFRKAYPNHLEAIQPQDPAPERK